MQQMGMGGNLINLFLEWTVIVPLFLPQNILLLFLHVSLPFNYSLLYLSPNFSSLSSSLQPNQPIRRLLPHFDRNHSVLFKQKLRGSASQSSLRVLMSSSCLKPSLLFDWGTFLPGSRGRALLHRTRIMGTLISAAPRAGDA